MFIFYFRISLRMVWHDYAWWLSYIHFKRMYIWYSATNLFATTCRINTQNRGANGSNNWCSNQIKKYSIAERLFMP